MDRLRTIDTSTLAPSIRDVEFAGSRCRNWKAIVFTLVSACLLIVSSACSGGSSSSSSSSDPVTVTVSPTSATLPVSTSQQFSAVVSNASDTDVTWQVNGTAGGSSTYGTITTSGLYTAPAAVPTGAVTVTAVSKADTTKTATASVSISAANSLVASPAQASIPAGGQQTFSATLGSETVSATWSVSCNTSNYGCGTISSSGVYTAPLSPPPGASVTIRASSTGANSATVNAVITFGSGALIGPYSFAMQGAESGQPYSSVGSISFDGKGGITGGIEDRPGRATPVTITGGTYVADSQGRVAATVHTDAGDESWQITLVNHSRAFITRTDSVVARGDMDLQDTLQFGKALSGPFTFHLSGSSASGPAAAAGMVGALTFDQQGNLTSGLLDSNDGGTVVANASVTGASTTSNSSYGRGTLSISSSFGPQTFAYYIINSTSARLIETDGAHDLTGKLLSRTASTAVTPSFFQGDYAFVFSGADKSGAVAQGGTFSLNASGTITTGTLDRSTDSAFALGFLMTGSLVVTDAATGRSIVTFNSGATALQYVVYPPSPNYNNTNKYGLAFLEIDNSNVTTGVALQKGGTSYEGTSPSFAGHFSLLLGETSSAVRRTLTGPILVASTPIGTVDVVDSGNISLATPLQSTSRFSLTSLSGRGQLQLQTGGYAATYTTYIVDENNALLIETDGKGVLTGGVEGQY